MVAVKRVELEGWREDAVERLMRKINLVKQLSHPSIIKYESITRDENMLNIVLEYASSLPPFPERASLPSTPLFCHTYLLTSCLASRTGTPRMALSRRRSRRLAS